MTNQPNFRRADVKAKSLYKLWVKYLPSVTNKKLPIIKVYYSYEKKGEPDFGYNRLLAMLLKRLHKIRIAILYDNRTHKEIKRFENDQNNRG
ncbi:MAG TPA: hypothetical protein VK750_01980 [Cytophagaceae bacterium]|jgi:hypothetical protein|nr:hypothetical protein [Cytophagaceae bacterium]